MLSEDLVRPQLVVSRWLLENNISHSTLGLGDSGSTRVWLFGINPEDRPDVQMTLTIEFSLPFLTVNCLVKNLRDDGGYEDVLVMLMERIPIVRMSKRLDEQGGRYPSTLVLKAEVYVGDEAPYLLSLASIRSSVSTVVSGALLLLTEYPQQFEPLPEHYAASLVGLASSTNSEDGDDSSPQ